MSERPISGTTMKGTALAVMALLSLQPVLAQVPAQRTEYELPGDRVFPEGIAYHQSAGAVFVSAASAGGIYRIDLNSGAVTNLVEPGSREAFTTIGLWVDAQDRLWVAGGRSGQILLLDTGTGEQIGAFSTPVAEALFLNDVVVTAIGDAYVTDSDRPILWRVPAAAASAGGQAEAEPWLDFSQSGVELGEGFRPNGIVATPDGGTLIVVSASDGVLYRIDVASREVSRIDVGAEAFPGGDGLALAGNTLYVVQNGADQVAVVNLSDDLASGSLAEVIEDERLSNAATAALIGDALLVVNAQFSRMNGTPELPFTVSVIRLR